MFLFYVFAFAGFGNMTALGAEVLVKDTGIIYPLRREEVLLAKDGSFYILNYEEALIKKYNKDGRESKTLGFKGEGPGGLRFPWGMFLQDDKLLVADVGNSSVTIYSPDGKARRVAQPQRGLQLAKTSNGWVYGDWKNSILPKNPANVRWSDDRFTSEIQLLVLPERGISSGFNKMTEGGETKATWTPVGFTPRLAASLDGNTVFVAEANKFIVHVFDVVTKKEIRVIRKNYPAIIFDKEWGEKGRQIKQEGQVDNVVKVEGIYPEYFPTIRQFFVGPEGYLLFNLWRAKPDQNNFLVVLDSKGNEIANPDLNWELCERMVGIQGNWAYITVYDDDKETAGLARVPRKDAVAYVKENPINFEGENLRTVNF